MNFVRNFIILTLIQYVLIVVAQIDEAQNTFLRKMTHSTTASSDTSPKPSALSSSIPSFSPTVLSSVPPSFSPTVLSSVPPSPVPSTVPPSNAPTVFSSVIPSSSMKPTSKPTISHMPSKSMMPSNKPSISSKPSSQPSNSPVTVVFGPFTAMLALLLLIIC